MHVFLLDETFYTLYGIPWRKPLSRLLLPACQPLFELLRKFGSISSRITETVEYIVSGKYCYISEMMNYLWSVVFPFYQMIQPWINFIMDNTISFIRNYNIQCLLYVGSYGFPVYLKKLAQSL